MSLLVTENMLPLKEEVADCVTEQSSRTHILDCPVAKRTCLRCRSYQPNKVDAFIQLGGSLGDRGSIRA